MNNNQINDKNEANPDIIEDDIKIFSLELLGMPSNTNTIFLQYMSMLYNVMTNSKDAYEETGNVMGVEYNNDDKKSYENNDECCEGCMCGDTIELLKTTETAWTLTKIDSEGEYKYIKDSFINFHGTGKNKFAFFNNDREIKGEFTINKNNEIVDEVLVSYFKEPKSYTTENMCEINSHGGILIVRQILDLCLKMGANLAEPGEFTKRAFLNGRINLIEADGIMDMINAKTTKMGSMAMQKINGNTSNKIKEIRQ